MTQNLRCFFLALVGYSAGISAIIYIGLGSVFIYVDMLKPLHMIPFYIVLTLAGGRSVLELAITMMNGIYICGTFLGAELTSVVYLYLVNMKLNNGQ